MVGIVHALTAVTPNSGGAEIQPSNWNADHVITGQVDFPLVASPATPASGYVGLFGRKIAERMLPAFVGPSGLESSLQPTLARNKVVYYNPIGNSTTVPGIFGSAAFTVTGTITARNVAVTNLFTRVRRTGYVSAAAAGSLVTLRNSTLQFTVGNGAGLGGFFWVGYCGISDAAAVSGARMFYGMMGSASVLTNVEPSTLVNCFGIGHGAADTNMKLFYGGSAAQTPIDLGANFPNNTLSTDWYELALFAPSGVANTVHWQVTRVTTGHVASGTITGGAAVLPQSGTLMTFLNSYRTNNATALAVGLDIGTVYCETDY